MSRIPGDSKGKFAAKDGFKGAIRKIGNIVKTNKNNVTSEGLPNLEALEIEHGSVIESYKEIASYSQALKHQGLSVVLLHSPYDYTSDDKTSEMTQLIDRILHEVPKKVRLQSRMSVLDILSDPAWRSEEVRGPHDERAINGTTILAVVGGMMSTQESHTATKEGLFIDCIQVIHMAPEDYSIACKGDDQTSSAAKILWRISRQFRHIYEAHQIEHFKRHSTLGEGQFWNCHELAVLCIKLGCKFIDPQDSKWTKDPAPGQILKSPPNTENLMTTHFLADLSLSSLKTSAVILTQKSDKDDSRLIEFQVKRAYMAISQKFRGSRESQKFSLDVLRDEFEWNPSSPHEGHNRVGLDLFWECFASNHPVMLLGQTQYLFFLEELGSSNVVGFVVIFQRGNSHDYHSALLRKDYHEYTEKFAKYAYHCVAQIETKNADVRKLFAKLDVHHPWSNLSSNHHDRFRTTDQARNQPQESALHHFIYNSLCVEVEFEIMNGPKTVLQSQDFKVWLRTQALLHRNISKKNIEIEINRLISYLNVTREHKFGTTLVPLPRFDTAIVLCYDKSGTGSDSHERGHLKGFIDWSWKSGDGWTASDYQLATSRDEDAVLQKDIKTFLSKSLELFNKKRLYVDNLYAQHRTIGLSSI